jgi:hypothetical protein
MRVVSLAVYLPVPYAAQRLTTLGAEVTAVEPPSGDPFAQWCPAYYAQLRAGQRVVRLDIKSPDGQAALDTLLCEADLLLTASRPASLRRLGLDWEHLHATYPRLSHVALVGWASPDDERPSHDLMLQAMAGLTSPPELPRTTLDGLARSRRTRVRRTVSTWSDNARGVARRRPSRVPLLSRARWVGGRGCPRATLLVRARRSARHRCRNRVRCGDRRTLGTMGGPRGHSTRRRGPTVTHRNLYVLK